MKETTIRKLFKFQPTVRLINHGDLTLLQTQSINSFWQSLQKYIPWRYRQNTSFYIGERGRINVWLQNNLLYPEMLPHLYSVGFFYFKIIVIIIEKSNLVCSSQQIKDFQGIETTPPGLTVCLLCHHTQLCCPHTSPTSPQSATATALISLSTPPTLQHLLHV